jgi:exopolyphosphatase / guanosine-5'-triphosphate,3'-diphosphate pyrophosphatase
VHAVGRRFGYEEVHAFHVARIAETIFDQLTPVYKLARRERILLSVASLLHDVGYHIAHESHHKHSLYLIKFSELTGFSEAERLLIANIARYHRGPTPKERHPEYALLNQADRETVCRLAAILRISDALDKSYDCRVKDVSCVRDGQMVHMELKSSLNCEKEILAAEQKGDLFENAFNCKLTFSKGVFARRA